LKHGSAALNCYVVDTGFHETVPIRLARMGAISFVAR